LGTLEKPEQNSKQLLYRHFLWRNKALLEVKMAIASKATGEKVFGGRAAGEKVI